MALVTCPDCENKVSGRADVCIHCGSPLKVEGQTVYVKNVRKGKKRMLIGFIIAMVGLLTISSEPGFAGAMFLIGIVVIFSGKFSYWWHN